jgi:hypothetical protein
MLVSTQNGVEAPEIIAARFGEDRTAKHMVTRGGMSLAEFTEACIAEWKPTIFEEHETTQAEFDASCGALLGGGGVGGRGANLAQLRQALQRVEDGKTSWNKLLAEADEDINKKAGVSGRLTKGAQAPVDVSLTGRGGSSTTIGGLLSEKRHSGGLLLVVLRHFG